MAEARTMSEPRSCHATHYRMGHTYAGPVPLAKAGLLPSTGM